MTVVSIQESVIGVIKDVICKSVDLDQSLVVSGLLDSMGIVSLVADLERTFNIAIGFEEILPEVFDSARSISALIAEKLN